MPKLSQKQKQKIVLEQLEEGGPTRVWDCKIGYAFNGELPNGADFPMRRAISKQFKKLTGREPLFIFSGWGGSLTDIEKSVVERKI